MGIFKFRFRIETLLMDRKYFAIMSIDVAINEYVNTRVRFNGRGIWPAMRELKVALEGGEW